MITSDQQAIIVDSLVQRVDGLRAVYIFGSRAEDDNKNVRKDSDFDIAFLASHKPTFTSYEKFLLQGKLAEKLKTEWVDLIDIGSVKDHTLRLNVLKGKRIYCLNEDDVIEWEAKSITMAQDWIWKSKPYRDAEMSDIRKRVEDYHKEKAR
jgi:predicted nucleotidyltransferase